MRSSATLFETLFRRTQAEPGNADLLSGITAAHPYFTPAHFFLLEQTAKGANGYKEQAARTSLLFNNSHWLNFQLLHSSATVTALIEEPVTDAPDNTDHITEETMEKEIEPMKLELKIPEHHHNDTAETPLFEPMHLVDYFASQGIKLTEELQTADKLGKQLKSFTEWLKTMKKVHGTGPVEPLPAAVKAEEQTDAAIQTLAEKSNKDGQVLTEAMAEVFAKQGKHGKATEVYEKLSLLNPSKIAYFAAKIEQLKGT